ncbi:MAG: DNA internalization-related competence protein ComEC/Rec2 [Burkholderiaceae bacterium]|nr:DNA internalization-related competence protein ComEC/Rec2 [Burkholderiaceae bacterium]
MQDARKYGWTGWALALGPAGWVAGTALQVGQPALWALSAYAALAGLGCALGVAAWLARKVTHRATAPLALLALMLAAALLAFAGAGWRATAKVADRIAPALEGRDVLVTGVIDRMPERGADGWRFPLAVRDARLLDAAGRAGDAVRLPARVLVSWYIHGYGQADAKADAAADAGLTLPAPLASPASPASPATGQVWRFALRLKAPHGNRNPHGFDAELWFWEQGVGATGYVRTGGKSGSVTPRLLAPASRYGGWIERARQWTRDRILADAASGDAARQRQAGIVAALVTGDQATIARDDWTLFRVAGVAHLMVISGLHITMIGWLAGLVAGWFWRAWARRAPSRWRNPVLWLPAPVASRIGGVAGALLYALFSGWGVPAQRTVLMLALVTLLRLAGLAWPWRLTWLWAMAVVLAADPWALMQPGVWLSFVAVGILFATSIDEWRARRASGSSAAGAGRYLWRQAKALLHQQGVATIALTPLTLLLFHQASVVGLLANLVAIPWVTLVVTPLALLGALAHPLWLAAQWALWPLLVWLQWLASWPLAALTWPAVPWSAGAAAIAGGVLLALRWPWALRLAGVPLLAGLALWAPGRPPAGQFELLAADIGQGSAALLLTAHHALLFDAGPRYSATSDAGSREIVPLLVALGVRLDGVMLSHRDIDHTGGAAAVLQAQPGAWLMESESSAPEGAPGHTPLLCLAGQSWDWDGVHFQVLHPPASRYVQAADPNASAKARDTNARSCVLRVAAQGGRGAAVMLTGDIPARQERELVLTAAESGINLHADALVVPHHGSHNSSSPAFIAAVRPRFALAQAGYRNRYGHPNPEVVMRYHSAGVDFIATPACGAIRWYSAQPDRVHCERVEAAHYWQHRVAEP